MYFFCSFNLDFILDFLCTCWHHMYIYIYIKEEILLEKILKDHCIVSCLLTDVWLWSIGNQWWSECCCTDSYFPFLQWTRMLTWTWLWGPQCLPAPEQQARGVPLPGDWSVNRAIPQTVHTPTNKNVIYKLLLQKGWYHYIERIVIVLLIILWYLKNVFSNKPSLIEIRC